MERLRRFLLSMTLILASTAMSAQEITGTVVDETGEGVIGATIKEKGTSNGTVTDFDGNFKIKAKQGATHSPRMCQDRLSIVDFQRLEKLCLQQARR